MLAEADVAATAITTKVVIKVMFRILFIGVSYLIVFAPGLVRQDSQSARDHCFSSRMRLALRAGFFHYGLAQRAVHFVFHSIKNAVDEAP